MFDQRNAGAWRTPVTASRTETVGRQRLAALVSWLLVIVVLPAASSDPLRAQISPAPQVETLTLKAYRMVHQPAREALPLIEPLLSSEGSLQLQMGNNTLVIRDHPSVIRRIEPLLREFDHPPQELPLEIHLLEAQLAEPDSDPKENTKGLPPGLVASLGVMARVNRYRVVAAIDLEPKEGESVSYEMGSSYQVRFTVGTLLIDKHVKLHRFEVLRPMGDVDRQLFLGNLNLILGKTMVVAVADAGLAIAVTCAPETAIKSPSARGVGAEP